MDPLMVKGSVRNKTAFEVIKLIEATKESAGKVRGVSDPKLPCTNVLVVYVRQR